MHTIIDGKKAMTITSEIFLLFFLLESVVLKNAFFHFMELVFSGVVSQRRISDQYKKS